MTERERLIELLDSGCFEAISKCKGEDSNKKLCEFLADKLLANGVIVPPVVVGDTVYVISRGDIVPMEVDTVQLTRKGYNILGRNERYWGNGTITLHPNYGAEWYITREAAEKSLKERTNEKTSNV